MQHFFDCDNCGKTVETHCFDTSANIVTYKTPVVQERWLENDEMFQEWIKEYFASASTTLCRECINQ